MSQTSSFGNNTEYRANFLWPFESGSLEEAGYEFANGLTEAYRERWWQLLNARIKDGVKISKLHTR